MLFNSLDYILFLGIAVAGFWLLARHAQLRIIFVFVASCLFYMAWHPAYIVLILGSTLVDYIVGLRIHATDRPKARKRWLILSLVSNLGLLALFKYFNFASQATADVLGLFFGIEIASPPFLDVLLPVGISFYTFQTLSYTIDIYRRKLEPTRNFFQFAFFVTYFPQLVAGPIVRASQLLPQLQRKITLRDEQVTQGLFLIASGMVKKVVIADYLSVNLVDRVFDQPELYSAAEVVIALYGFTMQIYCDFSGYTDVARGSAKLMGLELPENFDRPYQSASPAEFWRRWHITLSTWLRDYLYFPLGGSRVGPVRAYWNLWLTMFLIGIWHGASWTFVFYAILQSMAMVIHRFFYRRSGRTSDTVDTWRMHAFKVGECTRSRSSGRFSLWCSRGSCSGRPTFKTRLTSRRGSHPGRFPWPRFRSASGRCCSSPSPPTIPPNVGSSRSSSGSSRCPRPHRASPSRRSASS
ncbi:MAG: MBOAT family protein [Deltaproteobacteria bacterium]|nr:MBOAT family protein [Deltaproteobacteria bacterium]